MQASYDLATRWRQWAPGPSPGATVVCVLNNASRRLLIRLLSQAAQVLAPLRDVGVVLGEGLGEGVAAVAGRHEVEIVALGRLHRRLQRGAAGVGDRPRLQAGRSEEHTSELQSIMRISYAIFCLKTKIH